MKKIVCVLALCVLIVSGLCAQTSSKFTGWKQAETEHFTFVFEEASREAANAYAEIADEAWNKVAEAYGLPREKITVYVMGRTDTINAYTYVAPLAIGMFDVPFVMPDFTYRDEWVKFVFTHELIHSANMAFETRENFAAQVFGKIFNALDFSVLPKWEVEGLTTVLETELSAAGRGRSPYFEMLYKAHAMEGSMVEYYDIGKDAVAPRGQSYVYGYLMMRSLADRWGLDTLADIERNRAPNAGSLEDSVVKITGEHPADIWQDIKIALNKKYANERLIPEGKIITSRDVYFYKPAVIFDDGTFISLRRIGEELAAVLVDPALPTDEDKMDNLSDGKPVSKETVLFTGTFSDVNALTADKDGRVYASLEIKSADRGPGEVTTSQIFSWDKENGLKQLTDGPNYLQPSVSADGTTLVALEQTGLRLRLVQIDTETGAVTPLLDDASYDFALPSVNQAGSKVALIRVGGGRGAVAYLDLKDCASGVVDASALTVVANGSGQIVDPSYPSWTNYGTLTYCSNDRGRLEVYEVTDNGNGNFTSKPVLADPVAALWAYPTSRGIYYASYASNGYVVKMKPASEWGNVPDWNGPSMPGEIVHLGDLETDYPDFMPFKNGDMAEFEKRNKDLMVNETTIKAPVKELQNERGYINLPKTMLLLPSMSITPVSDDEYAFGFGASYLAMSNLLMGKMNMIEADACYYPTLGNFTADISARLSLGNTMLDLLANRLLQPVNDKFGEISILMAGLSIPFYNRTTPVSYSSLSSITTVAGGIQRVDDAPFAVNADIAVKYLLSGAVGIGFDNESWTPSKSFGVLTTASAVGLTDWANSEGKLFFGGEAELEMLFGGGSGSYTGFSLNGRYMDATASLRPSSSTLKHAGKSVSCENPFNLVGRFESVSDMNSGSLGPLGAFKVQLNIYEEAMVSLSRNGSFVLDDILSTGAEIKMNVGREAFATGITFDYNLSSKEFSLGELYISAKANFIRR